MAQGRQAISTSARPTSIHVVGGSQDLGQEESVGKIDRPSQLFVLAAFISMLFSIYLWFFVDKDAGVFVGLWVPSILAFGALMRLPR